MNLVPNSPFPKVNSWKRNVVLLEYSFLWQFAGKGSPMLLQALFLSKSPDLIPQYLN